MTSLNIGAVLPDQRTSILKPSKGPCPSCGAGPDKRETSSSFGSTATKTLCSNCAHEFKEPTR
jgi:hypothetical protein